MATDFVLMRDVKYCLALDYWLSYYSNNLQINEFDCIGIWVHSEWETWAGFRSLVKRENFSFVSFAISAKLSVLI